MGSAERKEPHSCGILSDLRLFFPAGGTQGKQSLEVVNAASVVVYRHHAACGLGGLLLDGNVNDSSARTPGILKNLCPDPVIVRSSYSELAPALRQAA